MPRNGSGVASVVNTFTPLTTADANAVNANFTDLADEITNSLPRDGQAGMTGQLQAISGTVTEPGISFTADPNTGIRRPAGDQLSLVCGGADVATASSTGLSVSTAPTTGDNLANKTYVDAQIAARGEPPGVVDLFAASTPPTGWLECNGAAVSRTTYAALFTVIGTTWGTGDGSTTFNVPDLRGEFVRGWDHGKGTDTGRAFASSQADEFESHVHAQRGAGLSGSNTTAQYSTNLTATGDQLTSTSATGGTETRPRNVALMYIIKT